MITKFNSKALYYKYLIHVFLLSALNMCLFKTLAFNNFYFDVLTWTGIKQPSVSSIDYIELFSTMSVGILTFFAGFEYINVIINKFCHRDLFIKIDFKNNKCDLAYSYNRIDASNPFLYSSKCCGLLE